jgi:hypothetical protein
MLLVGLTEFNHKMIVFALLAALGLFISSAANISTYFGVEPMNRWPCVWFLHLGIFVVFVPAIAVGTKGRTDKAFRWRDAVGNAPAWMRWMLVSILLHAPINGMAFAIVGGGGGPSRQPDGTYAMTSHGRILRTLTAGEYHRATGYEFRFTSSWWMLFYCISLVLLISQINRQKELADGQDAGAQARAQHGILMPIWLHQTILLFCIMFGWVGVPALTAIYVLPLFGNLFGRWSMLVVVGAWVFGVFVPAGLVRRLVPARCPECGGRAGCESVLNWTYRCPRCGHFEKRTK